MEERLGIDRLLSPIYIMILTTIIVGLLLGSSIMLILKILVEFSTFYNLILIVWLIVSCIKG